MGAKFKQYLLKLSHISQVIVVLIYTIAIVIVYLHGYYSRVYRFFIYLFSLNSALFNLSLPQSLQHEEEEEDPTTNNH